MAIKEHSIILARKLDMEFSLNSSFTPYKDVFSERGMLPGIAQRAEQLCLLCLGYGLGMVIEKEEKSMLGKLVTFDEMTPNSLRLLFIAHILSELKEVAGGKKLVPLDELIYD